MELTYMLISVVCLSLFVGRSYGLGLSDGLYSKWTTFKVDYGKRYTSVAEEAVRLRLFAKNKLRVEQFNEDQSAEAGYSLGVNHMSVWTEDEFKQLLGFKHSELDNLQTNRTVSSKLQGILDSEDPLPDFVDWRQQGRVSSVKDQGQCGSCWAFSVAGTLEGQELPVKKIKVPISLSPQNIMDCGNTFVSQHPCSGGDTKQALIDSAAMGGVESEKDYPYLATNGSCKLDKSRVVIRNLGVDGLPPKDEEFLKRIVAKVGPISVAIEVSQEGDFRNYKSGVYTDKHCDNEEPTLNHAVLVVGYGSDPKDGDYWIVKNSWSSNWGDQGYIKMARNKGNMCGIASYSMVPGF